VTIIEYIHRIDCCCTLHGALTVTGRCVNEISCYRPRGCRGNIHCLSAYIGCQHLVYGCLWSSVIHITEDARPQIVDTPLTLIVKMWQGGYRYLFCLYRWQIIPLWLTTTCHPSDYPGCKTKYRWHCVDAHFKDGVGSVSLEFLPI